PRHCSGLVAEVLLGLGGRGVARCLVAEALLGLLRPRRCSVLGSRGIARASEAEAQLGA
ncbi:unnamed protein product, partial [Musa textilis]